MYFMIISSKKNFSIPMTIYIWLHYIYNSIHFYLTILTSQKILSSHLQKGSNKKQII